VARQAKSLLDELRTIEDGEQLTRLVYAEALRAAGEEAEARRALESAHDALTVRAERIKDPALREAFLRIPENARTIELFHLQ
jgi:hypothetical protein